METKQAEMERIVQILRSFKVGVEEIKSCAGPSVTLYEIRPSDGVRVSKVRNLKDEIAIGLAVPAVRIIAPMDNGMIGIEVPNREREIIPVSEMLSSDEYENTSMELPLALGRTISGEIFMADLTEMPHLLVAGATGQGKSVGLNVMLLSLLNKKSPDELRLILIDPKQVELNLYSELGNSYLMSPVVTDPCAACDILSAVCTIMEKRYDRLNECGVRNIQEYNAVNSGNRLPYIVVVIDEYGDLVMTAGKPMEKAICRIAQKARAVGIHMIISTQRPSATIVTGNIKANFPTRIAFRTTTGTDSRVVLDHIGAEKLMGKGDMLFSQGVDNIRVQCAYASVEDVTSLCKKKREEYENGTAGACEVSGANHGGNRIRLSHAIFPFTKRIAMLVSVEKEVSEGWIKENGGVTTLEARQAFKQLTELGILSEYARLKGLRVTRDVIIKNKLTINRLIEDNS